MVRALKSKLISMQKNSRLETYPNLRSLEGNSRVKELAGHVETQRTQIRRKDWEKDWTGFENERTYHNMFFPRLETFSLSFGEMIPGFLMAGCLK